MKKPVFHTWICCTRSCKQILLLAITIVSDTKDLTYISLYSGLCMQPWDFGMETQAISKNWNYSTLGVCVSNIFYIKKIPVLGICDTKLELDFPVLYMFINRWRYRGSGHRGTDGVFCCRQCNGEASRTQWDPRPLKSNLFAHVPAFPQEKVLGFPGAPVSYLGWSQ